MQHIPNGELPVCLMRKAWRQVDLKTCIALKNLLQSVPVWHSQGPQGIWLWAKTLVVQPNSIINCVGCPAGFGTFPTWPSQANDLVILEDYERLGRRGDGGSKGSVHGVLG